MFYENDTTEIIIFTNTYMNILLFLIFDICIYIYAVLCKEYRQLYNYNSILYIGNKFILHNFLLQRQYLHKPENYTCITELQYIFK